MVIVGTLPIDGFDDVLPDGAAIAAGAWDDGRYGRGDRLGSYVELGAASTARALATVDAAKPVRTFSLGQTLFVGYPGWGSRQYRQRLATNGFDPGPEFAGEIVRRSTSSPNQMTSLEERVELSYNLGSKVNGLAHAGVGGRYYGGRDVNDLVADHGVVDLDTTTWGPPVLTRGLLVDVLATKLESDASVIDHGADGRAVLRGDYRITIEDILEAIERQGLPAFEPGDAVLLRTGWSRLIGREDARYLAGSPGVWLRETRWLAAHRPAVVGTDSWCWGTTAPAVMGKAVGACHQELLVRFGIRFGESMALEDLASAGVDRFMYCHNPIRAVGAVSTNSPPIAIANVAQ